MNRNYTMAGRRTDTSQKTVRLGGFDEQKTSKIRKLFSRVPYLAFKQKPGNLWLSVWLYLFIGVGSFSLFVPVIPLI